MSKGRRAKKPIVGDKADVAQAPQALVAATIAQVPTLPTAARKRLDELADQFMDSWRFAPASTEGDAAVFAFSLPVGASTLSTFISGRGQAPKSATLEMDGASHRLVPVSLATGWMAVFRPSAGDRFWVALRLTLQLEPGDAPDTIVVRLRRRRERLSMVQATLLPANSQLPQPQIQAGFAAAVTADIRTFLAAGDTEGAIALALMARAHPLIAPEVQPVLADVIAAAANEADFAVSPGSIRLLLALSA